MLEGVVSRNKIQKGLKKKSSNSSFITDWLFLKVAYLTFLTY